MRARAILVVAVIATAVGCYKPSSNECVYECNATSGCPAGLACNGAGFCVEPGSTTVCVPGDGGDDGPQLDGPGDIDAPMPVRRYRALSAGAHHACAIDTDGQLWCWGANDARQLGVSTGGENFAGQPQHVQPAMTGGEWNAIAAGGGHTCGLFTPNGGVAQLWCWGLNFSYQTGSTGASPTTPHQIAVPAGLVWRQIAAGGQHTCAILEDITSGTQTVRCFGDNTRRQLGSSVSGMTATVTSIDASQIPSTTTYRSLTAGTDHTCAIASDSRAYCWGDNVESEGGRAGGGTLTPGAVQGSAQWSAIGAGDSFTCGIESGSSVLYCWGRNGAIELGSGPGPNLDTPTAVLDAGTAAKWKSLALGQYGACGIQGPAGSTDAIGSVRCWGANDFGERGTGTFLLPTAGPSAPAVDNAFAVAAGHLFACALVGNPVSGGDLRCWGDNGDGQIGTGQASDHRRPVRVGEGVRNGQSWIAVAAGRAHTCAILGAAATTGRQLFCWGLGSSGQLDAVPSMIKRTPQRVSGADGGMELVVGSSHTCVYRELPAGGRQIMCFGSDEAKQLGVAGNQQPGPTMLSLQPFFPTGIRGAGNVTCGANPSGAQCWGEPELATSDYINSDMAAALTLDTSDVPNETFAAGPSSGCWIDTGNARTLCFGSNSFGQLGYGMSAQPATHPVAVMGLTDATSLSVGPSNHHCATTSNRVVKCWGANGFSQAGNNDGVDKNAPVTVMTPNQFDSVVTGLNHTCGLDGGVISCWGNNDQFQRTAIASGSSLPPTPIVGPLGEAMPTWTAMASGEYHTCAISTTGTLYCWGASRWGQVGAGTASETSPVSVIDGTL